MVLGNVRALSCNDDRLIRLGYVVSGVAELPMLEVLDVSQNRLTGSLPAHWTSAKLVELDAHDNALTGPLPASLAQLPRLAYVQLQVTSRKLFSVYIHQIALGVSQMSKIDDLQTAVLPLLYCARCRDLCTGAATG